MLHPKSIARILGHLLTILGCAMALPLVMAAARGESEVLAAILLPESIALVAGLALSYAYRDASRQISQRDGMLAVLAGWVCASLLGALPYLLSGILTSPISALFESVSSFTTTGATVLRDLSVLPSSLLMWRSFSQWLGGLAILVLIRSLMPAAFSGSSSILQSGTPEINTDSLSFSPKSAARMLYFAYIGMTAAQAALLRLAGLSAFDSVLFSFSTAASGGLTGYSDGLLHVGTPAVEAILAVFMVLSCVNFTAYMHIFRRSSDKLRQSTELKAYFAFLAAGILLVSVNLWTSGTYARMGQALRFGGFQAVSFMTTTGLASADYTVWPTFSKCLMSILSFIGGCTSSTGGALKVIRVVILAKMVWRSFTTRIHPSAVVTIKVNQKPLPSQIANSVVSYTLIFFAIFLTGAFLLSFDALDFETAFHTASAMLCNVGSTFGETGIFGCCDMFGGFSKLVMCFLMLAGRLEIYAVLLPFSRSFRSDKSY